MAWSRAAANFVKSVGTRHFPKSTVMDRIGAYFHGKASAAERIKRIEFLQRKAWFRIPGLDPLVPAELQNKKLAGLLQNALNERPVAMPVKSEKDAVKAVTKVVDGLSRQPDFLRALPLWDPELDLTRQGELKIPHRWYAGAACDVVSTVFGLGIGWSMDGVVVQELRSMEPSGTMEALTHQYLQVHFINEGHRVIVDPAINQQFPDYEKSVYVGTFEELKAMAARSETQGRSVDFHECWHVGHTTELPNSYSVGSSWDESMGPFDPTVHHECRKIRQKLRDFVPRLSELPDDEAELLDHELPQDWEYPAKYIQAALAAKEVRRMLALDRAGVLEDEFNRGQIGMHA